MCNFATIVLNLHSYIILVYIRDNKYDSTISKNFVK